MNVLLDDRINYRPIVLKDKIAIFLMSKKEFL
jgi:hypothetical protein